MVKINQKDNYEANFGFCPRSSSIFYIPPKHIKTSLVLSNYWSFKNNIKVFLIASYRNMNGDLLKREHINFDGKNVAELNIPEKLIGSCEIEAFSNTNLRIPYSAIMVVYEAKKSISMVHSYARVYSQMEVEDKKTICDGHEGCWTLKDTNEIESFAVMHNGSTLQKNQKIKLQITNYKGKKKYINVPISSMKPYETRVIKPREYFANICDFLEGQNGSCSIHFKVSNSFTRLLIGWETIDKTQLQVTHSNFDYSKHETDLIDCEYNYAHMPIPKIPNKKVYTLIYPEKTPGDYLISSEKIIKHSIKDQLYFSETEPQDLKIQRVDGKLPSRIVTAIEIKSKEKGILPCECSLGVAHKLVPPKRFHWSIWSASFNSSLIISAIKKIFGNPENAKICIRLYSQETDRIDEEILDWEGISADGINASLNLKKIFSPSSIDMQKFMYVSLFSNYGGFLTYTTLEKGNSMSIEHSF